MPAKAGVSRLTIELESHAADVTFLKSAAFSLSSLSLSSVSLSLFFSHLSSDFWRWRISSPDRDFVDQRETRERIKRESHETEAWVLVGSVT